MNSNMPPILSPAILLGAGAELAAATIICCKRIKGVQQVAAAVHGLFFAGGSMMLVMGSTLRWLFSSSQGLYAPHIAEIERMAATILVPMGEASLVAAGITYSLLPSKKI